MNSVWPHSYANGAFLWFMPRMALTSGIPHAFSVRGAGERFVAIRSQSPAVRYRIARILRASPGTFVAPRGSLWSALRADDVAQTRRRPAASVVGSYTTRGAVRPARLPSQNTTRRPPRKEKGARHNFPLGDLAIQSTSPGIVPGTFSPNVHRRSFARRSLHATH